MASCRIIFLAAAILAATLTQSSALDLHDLDFAADDELDWTASSVLGLQRGYTLHKGGSSKVDKKKKVVKKKAANTEPPISLEQGSLLGLQRSMKLHKKAPAASSEARSTEVGSVQDQPQKGFLPKVN
mmetsp:Transcript_32506/g.48659  ORF Transcript_32506/g.48659 Transcript_32506/m.48659 type:complete len:128 (+) Transcript_32506:3-386(+)